MEPLVLHSKLHSKFIQSWDPEGTGQVGFGGQSAAGLKSRMWVWGLGFHVGPAGLAELGLLSRTIELRSPSEQVSQGSRIRFRDELPRIFWSFLT